jgi:hypothetical protein
MTDAPTLAKKIRDDVYSAWNDDSLHNSLQVDANIMNGANQQTWRDAKALLTNDPNLKLPGFEISHEGPGTGGDGQGVTKIHLDPKELQEPSQRGTDPGTQFLKIEAPTAAVAALIELGGGGPADVLADAAAATVFAVGTGVGALAAGMDWLTNNHFAHPTPFPAQEVQDVTSKK